MKTLKGMALSMLGLVAAIAAVGCGDAIKGCQTTAQMLGWVIASCGLLATAMLPTTPASGGMFDEMPDVR